jgi:hypothetical protein
MVRSSPTRLVIKSLMKKVTQDNSGVRRTMLGAIAQKGDEVKTEKAPGARSDRWGSRTDEYHRIDAIMHCFRLSLQAACVEARR